MSLRTARYVAGGAHNSLMTATAIKLMKQKQLYFRIRRKPTIHTDRKKKRKGKCCEAAEKRKNCGKGRSASGERGSRFREIGVKTSEGEHVKERKKNIQETVEDKYRDRVAGYQGIDPG